MARLNVIERLLNQKIVVRESRRGWVAQTEEEAVA